MRSISYGVFVRLSSLVSRLKRIPELLFHSGQGELKYGAARFIRICPELPPVGIDDRPADRQPHPNSAGLRGVESLENALEMFRTNARPGIAHCHENATGLGLLGADQQLSWPPPQPSSWLRPRLGSSSGRLVAVEHDPPERETTHR